MSDGDIVVNLLLSPLELNFLQVAIDGLIDVQRDVIHDCANQSDDLEIEPIYEAIERLRVGLDLKQTLEVFNP
jgi:hypothetical protein